VKSKKSAVIEESQAASIEENLPILLLGKRPSRGGVRKPIIESDQEEDEDEYKYESESDSQNAKPKKLLKRSSSSSSAVNAVKEGKLKSKIES
jgi:hypothetical protein